MLSIRGLQNPGQDRLRSVSIHAARQNAQGTVLYSNAISRFDRARLNLASLSYSMDLFVIWVRRRPCSCSGLWAIPLIFERILSPRRSSSFGATRGAVGRLGPNRLR